ncbi:recombinase RecA [Halioglobus sp. HI00S01]|uniref:recombinase RecA n=1 Tax=Halioglobus sp. HI00S01 TaxID=1822214 RepID=UPI000823FD94|nr:recombinase RecA [Halioglobus sp. HI00S01]
MPKSEKNVKEGKRKALDTVLASIEKQFGAGTIMRMSDNRGPYPYISTGSLSVDIASGIGGFPKGKISEVFSPKEAAGKTTLTLQAIACCQAEGGIAAFIDAEHALDPVYAEALGVDMDQLLLSQPDNGEEALEVAETLVRSGAVDLIVVDSVAALTPKAEIEGEMGASHVGLQARLMSQAMRKITGAIKKNNSCLVFINQMRHKIGGYGNPETTTGGNALKFYASMRIEVRAKETIKDGDAVIGKRTCAKIVKNKLAPPFREGLYDLMFGVGCSREGEVLDWGVECGLVDKSGAWYSYQGNKIGQGRDNAKSFLRDNTDIAAEIEAAVRLDKLPRQSGVTGNVPAPDAPPANHTEGEGCDESSLLGGPVVLQDSLIPPAKEA